MFIIVIISSFMLCALMEYLLHKFYLHKSSGHPHISEHHVSFHGRKTYEVADASYKDIVSNIVYIIFSWLPCGIIGFTMYPQFPKLGTLFATIGFLYLLWVETVHYLFHKPHYYFIEDGPIFKKLKEHHRIHHIYYKTNFGIGSTLWDIILKTKKK